MVERLFEQGTLYCTGGVSEKTKKEDSFLFFVSHSLWRHSSGDWGELSEEDKQKNQFALENGFQLLSAYTYMPENYSYRSEKPTKIWIITEADRSATTVLFPEEY